LWCRCHTDERERQDALTAAGFQPLPERDLRLIHALALPLPSASLPHGFSLQYGVTSTELEAYQELHQAVFGGIGMSMDYHLSDAYQPELDLIARDQHGHYAAFCQCACTQITDTQGAQTVGEIGVIGTRPGYRQQGLGHALLITALDLLRTHGATGAFLETSESNAPARRLFASVGWTQLSTWQWHISQPEPSPPK
jgi:ribosomal protein S18 acetylase RimI-like enzyme